MTEHEPWVGAEYNLGIGGQRVAIVGYSHWGEEAHDTPEATRECVAQVISCEWRIRFFTQIRNYFGYDDHGAFWPRVLFFNFLPNLVGGPNRRFNHGTPEQHAHGLSRFERLIHRHRPDRVFVFTGRHWAFGLNNERRALPNFPKFSSRTYKIGQHTAKAFFLRHPQGASKDLMRRAVMYVIEEPDSKD